MQMAYRVRLRYICRRHEMFYVAQTESSGATEESPRASTRSVTANRCHTMVVNSTELSVNGKWVVVPALTVNGTTIIVRGRLIKIASVLSEDWLEAEFKHPQACVRELKDQRSHGVRADVFTFTQKVPGTLPKYRYSMEWDSIAVAPVASFKDWWEKLPQESRKNVRRSQRRGVTVRIEEFNDDLVKRIVGVNNDSPVRQGRRFTHYGKTFDQVKKDHSSFLDRSEFICAYLGSELIGFLKIVYRGEIASILQLLAKSRHYDKRPSNALLAKAVELCAARGVSYLTYGRFNVGNKRESAIREFKSRNGFQEILIPRFYVPLTTLGRLFMKLKLHRGLLGILPSKVIAGIVAARAKWYDACHLLSRRSSRSEQPNCNRPMECSNPPAGFSPEGPTHSFESPHDGQSASGRSSLN